MKGQRKIFNFWLATVGDSSSRIECDEAQEIFEILKKNDVYEWTIAEIYHMNLSEIYF